MTIITKNLKTKENIMATQKERYHMSMAGEYLVAAQLQRLQISSSITYGNAKRSDIMVFNTESEKCTSIEVKTTNKKKWPIGNRVPEYLKKIWVFVHLSSSIAEPPKFYILKQSEIYDILKPIEDKYLQNYKIKHGVEYGNRPGVTTITIKQVKKYIDNWEKIVDITNSNE